MRIHNFFNAFFILGICACSNVETNLINPTDPLEVDGGTASSGTQYKVTTLQSAKESGVSEGPLSKVFLNDINSLASDDLGNVYMADWSSSSVLVMSKDKNFKSINITVQNYENFPSHLFVSADGELMALKLYQKPEVLFYQVKNGGKVNIFENKLPGKDEFKGVSMVHKKADGKYYVAYGENLYTFKSDGIAVDNKIEVVIGGNQMLGNRSCMDKNENIYYIPDGFSTFNAGGKIFYLDKNLKNNVVKHDDLSEVDIKAYNSGDGKLPKAKIGEILSICADKTGNIYFVEEVGFSEMRRLRKISADGNVTTLAGGKTKEGNVDGINGEASFQYVHGMTVTPDGTIYISTDDGIRMIKKI